MLVTGEAIVAQEILDKPLWTQGYIDDVSFHIRYEGENLLVRIGNNNPHGIARSDTSLLDIYDISARTDDNGNIIELKRGDLLTSLDNDKSLIALTKLTLEHIGDLLDNELLSDEYFYKWLRYDHGGAITKLPYTRDDEFYSDYFFNEDRYLYSEIRGDKWGLNILDTFRTEEGFRWAHLLRIAVESRLKNDLKALSKALDSSGLLPFYEVLTAIKKQAQTTRDNASFSNESDHLSEGNIIHKWGGVLSPIFKELKTRSDSVSFIGFNLTWLNTLINSVWLGDVSLRLNRSIVSPNQSLKIATGLRTMKYEPALDQKGEYAGEFNIQKSQYSP